MITILQRVLEARVEVNHQTVGSIGPGMLVLAAVHKNDTDADVAWVAGKITSLRIFRRGDKHFDIDIREAGGSVLLVSNFTVAGMTRKGRRPSFDLAAGGELGRKRFDDLVRAVAGQGVPTATGIFGADMKVSLVNDGPVTFILDSSEARGLITPPGPATDIAG
jgi:D-tyrosyl-tRNA(Tyr) deacylase